MSKGCVLSIGVLTPHATPGPAAELPDMALGQVVTRVSRIPAAGADASSPARDTPSDSTPRPTC
jgi:hypothetical protein